MEICLFSHLAAVLENQNIATSHLKCCWVLCLFSLPMVISVEILKWKHPWLPSIIGESLSRWNIFTRGQVRTVFSQWMCTWTGLCWYHFIFPWRQFLCDEWGCCKLSLPGRKDVRTCVQVCSLSRRCLSAVVVLLTHCLLLIASLFVLKDLPINGLQFHKKESVVPHGVWRWSNTFKLFPWCRKETACEKKLVIASSS